MAAPRLKRKGSGRGEEEGEGRGPPPGGGGDGGKMSETEKMCGPLNHIFGQDKGEGARPSSSCPRWPVHHSPRSVYKIACVSLA